jgi:hypothetical protein
MIAVLSGRNNHPSRFYTEQKKMPYIDEVRVHQFGDFSPTLVLRLLQMFRLLEIHFG